MADGRVYETTYGWVAADDGGWLPGVFETEAEARAVAGPGAISHVLSPEVPRLTDEQLNDVAAKAYAAMVLDDYRADLRAKAAALPPVAVEDNANGAWVWRADVLALFAGGNDD